MQAVIMAGGEGSRLRPLTCTLPKPMVPLCNSPVMEHILALVSKHGCKEAVATLFTKPDQIKKYFGHGMHGVSLRYTVEEKPLGTAGSVKLATRGERSSFLVISGDVMTDIDLTSLIEFHRSHGAIATIALTQVETPLEFGVVLTDRDGRVTGFLEKPGWGEVISDLVNTGIYVLEPEAMDLVPADRPFDFSKDLFPRLLKEGLPMYAMHLGGYWCDIGTVEQYRKCNAECLNGRTSLALPGRQISPGVFVEEGAAVHPSAEFIPPVLIGRQAEIGAGVVIGPGSVVGPNTRVMAESKIAESIIWDHCTIDKRVTMDGCVLASGSSVGYRATLEKGAVLGCESTVGRYSTVWRSVKLWPKKNVEDRAFASSSVVFSDRSPRTLFGRHGVSGLANAEITPEICSKLAAAFSVGVPKLMVSCSEDGTSQMLGAAVMAGAQSSGAEVFSADNTLPPVLRYAARERHIPAIRVESPITRPGMVQVTFFDDKGLHISRDAQRKIEAALTREDSPKASPDRIKPVMPMADFSAHYIDALLSNLGISSPLRAAPKVMIEAPKAEARLMSSLLDRLGVEYEVSGDGLDFSPMQLPAVGASFGISLAPEGEAFSLLLRDDGYAPMESVTAILSRGWAELCGDKPLALPVSEPQAVRQFAEAHGANVTTVKSGPRAALEATPFSFLHDAFAATALLLALIDEERANISELLSEAPVVHYVRKTVLCPWEQKGQVMRRLASDPSIHTGVEGVFTEHEGSRVLVLPHAEEAVYELFVEASSWETADELSDVYAERLRSMINPK